MYIIRKETSSYWFIFLLCIGLLFLPGQGCGPGGTTIDDEKNTSGDGGVVIDQISPDKQIIVPDDAVTDQVVTDQEIEPLPETDLDTTPDQISECVTKGGYCTDFQTPCKPDYREDGALGCPGGRSAKCCLPDTPPVCMQEGETITMGTEDKCCSGLVAKPMATPPDCVPLPNMKYICVRCGDSICNSDKGENICNCPEDCQEAPVGPCWPKQKQPHTCPDKTEVPWCECDGQPPCIPVCKHVGTDSEGWYDSCSEKLIDYAPCGQCQTKPVCDQIGTRSEGWYDCNNKLIQWELCSQKNGTWSCIKSPENQCQTAACVSDDDCGKPACSEADGGCIQSKPHCVNGKCNTVKTPPDPNASCDLATGLCQTKPGCNTHEDCGKSSCSQTKSGCVQSKPLCTDGRCSNISTPADPNATCNATTGICQANPECKLDADCGNPSCSQSNSGCVQSKPICSNGSCMSAITPPDPNTVCDLAKGYCQPKPKCSADADCGKPSCSQSNSGCVQSKPFCSNGECFNSIAPPDAKSTCDATTGMCKPKPGCTTDADCGKPSCSQTLNGCVQSKPSCVNGQCSVSLTPPDANASCDAATGTCKPTSSCRTDADCGKPSCAQLGTTCIETKHICSNGKCLTSQTSASNATCDTQTGACKPNVVGECWPVQTKPYICPDGSPVPWCNCEGKPPCIPVCDKIGTRSEGWYDSCSYKLIDFAMCSACRSEPICDKIGTRSEGWYDCQGQLIQYEFCSQKNGKWSCIKSPENQCKTIGCTKDEDCGKLSCSQSNSGCVQSKPFCSNGRCLVATTPPDPNATCDTTTGYCKPNPVTCRTDEDCGKPSCSQAANGCVQSKPLCINGRCLIASSLPDPNSTCDTTTGYCKQKPVICRVDADCGKPSCSQTVTGCIQSKPVCSNGQCLVAVTRPDPNATCDPNTGTCKPNLPTCRVDEDCGKPSCTQSGKDCITTKPTCFSGICRDLQAVTQNATCDPNTGTCRPNIPTCRVDEDCGKPSCSQTATGCTQRKPSCVNGQCLVAISVPDPKATCDATTGYCKSNPPICRTDADCGKNSCSQVGTDCISTIHVCVNGLCQLSQKRTPNATCDPTTGLCKPSIPSCRVDEDCGKPSCSQSGTNCIAVKYSCVNGVCQTSIGTTPNATCDPATGTCKTFVPVCRVDEDCGKPSCSQSSQGCIQTKPSCINGQCLISVSMPDPNASCDSTTGQCKPKVAICRVDADCGKNSCVQLSFDCIATTYSCINGLCQTSQTRTNNATCDPATGNCKQTIPICRIDEDCGKPSCTQSGTDCIATKPSCVNGLCYSSQSKTANATCDPNTGTCKPSTSGECWPVQTKPYICPDGSPVPWCTCQGKAPCIPICDKIGTRSEGWYDSCTQQLIVFATCGVCKTEPICDKIGTRSEGWYDCNRNLISYEFCSQKNGTWSCIKSPENQCKTPACRSDADCGKPSCTQSGTNCIATKPSCINGVCQSSQSTTPNATCDPNTGTCKPFSPMCRTDEDCGKPSCSQSFAGCSQSKPTCVNGQCLTHVMPSDPTATCDPNTGLCQVSQGCLHHCDCKQGQTCVLSPLPGAPGTCTSSSSTKPIYCCTNAGCPNGQPCVYRDNSTGVCGSTPSCKSHCDCPQGLICVESSTGQNTCVAGIRPVYCCDNPGCPAGQPCTYRDGKSGTCSSSSIACRSDTDCKQTCTQSGTTCTQYIARCDTKTNTCVSQQLQGRCDQSTGICFLIAP